MKNREKTIAGLLLATGAAFGVTACSAPAAESAPTVVLHADYPTYDSVKALGSEGDLIVEVTVGKSVDDVLLPAYEGDDPASNPFAGTAEKPDPRRAGFRSPCSTRR